MNILILQRYGRMGASSRLRTGQYVPFLEAAGFRVTQWPLFDDGYLQKLYSKQSTLTSAARAYARRFGGLLQREAPDLIWIEKEAVPFLPWAVERRLLPKGVPVVADYDDAVFHRYDLHRSALVRRILGRKIDEVMRASALVTAGNSYLAARARSAGARHIEIVPTVLDTAAYGAASSSAEDRPAIGWIGSPSTWQEYMAPMMPMLTSLAAADGTRIIAVGAGRAADPHPLLDSLPWSEETEITRIQEMGLGIMPLNDSPWAQGKCGYKLIQYMACGLPVIASPVGVNAEIVEHGVNGFLASTPDEWRQSITILLRDPALRRKMGAAGRHKAEERYSLHTHGPRLAALLAGVAKASQP